MTKANPSVDKRRLSKTYELGEYIGLDQEVLKTSSSRQMFAGYNVSNQIKSKTSVIRSNLCDYSDAYLHVKWTITAPNPAAQGAAPNNRNKKVIFKNCAPFTNCINEINNTQVDDSHDSNANV